MLQFRVVAVLLVAANALSSLGSSQSKHKHSTQMSAGKSEKGLPDVEALLPSRSFSAMKSKVAALEKRLAEEHQERIGSLMKLKDVYEQKLKLSKRNTSRVERDNIDIASRIKEVKKSNDGLRRQATGLVKANKLLTIQLESFSSNLSLAQEFVQEGLAASAANASDVQVLAELTEQDEAARAISKKQSLLGEFGDPSRKLSLLATVGDVHEHAAGDIMGNLATSLSKLSEEDNTSQTVLREAFEKKLSEGLVRHEAALSDQASLNKTKSDVEKLHERLSAAVNHLSKIHSHLLARVKAIKSFAFSLGSAQSSATARQVTPKAESRESVRGARTQRSGTVRRSRSHKGNDGRTNTTGRETNNRSRS
jgi:hypothetical protein